MTDIVQSNDRNCIIYELKRSSFAIEMTYGSLRRYAIRIALVVIVALSAMHPQAAFSLPNCGIENLTIPAGPGGCDVQFGLSRKYDNGLQTSVALISTGLAVEMHKSQNTDGLWYHVGKRDGMNVTWGASQYLNVTGSWPQVAMSDDGYVVEVHSNLQYKSNSNLYYRVGKLNANGDQNQSINWLTGFLFWDAGFHASVGMVITNGQYTIVGVHETAQGGDGLYYRVGHLGSNSNIVWDSGASGINYTRDINPHISINNNGQIVEVHQVARETLVHYIRGTLGGGKIQFAGDQPRYNSRVTRPSVALNDNGFVTEVHDDGTRLGRMVGKLNPSNPALIDWSSNFIFDPEPGTYPAISSNGAYVIQSHQDGFELFFSISAIADRNNWMGDRLPSIGTKSLAGIVIPGAHDAGMYCDDLPGSLGQTQDQNLYDQLRGGVRYFDLRVKSGDPQRIYHGFSTIYCASVGSVMGDVRRFMQEGHKEAVVLKFSHFLDFGECLKTNEYNRLRGTITDNLNPWLYKQPVHPARVPINDLVSGGGKVIVVVDGDWAASQCGQVQPGFYVYKDWCSGSAGCDSTPNPQQGQFNVYDQYSKTTDYERMKNDQLNKFANYNGKMQNAPNIDVDLFLLSWTLTPITGVESVSAAANRRLADVMSTVSPNRYGLIPNILYVDFYERARVTDTAIRMTDQFNP